jgi:hypothetical protein
MWIAEEKWNRLQMIMRTSINNKINEVNPLQSCARDLKFFVRICSKYVRSSLAGNLMDERRNIDNCMGWSIKSYPPPYLEKYPGLRQLNTRYV